MSVKSRSKAKEGYKVLFGFKKDDPNITGYFSDDCTITTRLEKARFFPIKKSRKTKGFGTPEQWLKFLNDSDEELNFGFKFHLVSYTKKAAD